MGSLRLVALLAALLGGLPVAVLADARADAAVRAPRLDAFDSCRQLVRFARRNVLRSTTRRDIPVRALPAPVVALDPRLGAPAEGGSPTPQAQRDEAAGQQQSGTNVQEAGVDEPDLVKSDGSRVFTIVAGSLLAIDITGEQPRLVGSLPLDGSGHELLLHGGRALVVATAGTPAPAPIESTTAPEPARSAVSLTEVDVSNPAAMRVARTLIVDGSYVSARLSGATARVVLSSPPELVPAAAAIRRARLRSFVPEAVLRSRVSGRTYRRGLVGCSAVRRTASYSGVDLLTVLTIDLDKGLYDVDRDAVMAAAQTVYASPTSLFVASQRSLPSGTGTEIHRFDTSVPGATEYRSSGTVPGYLLNQFSLSEHAGALRVATTEEPPWGQDGAERRESESFVIVLQEREGRLVEVGRVGGLGRGERIHAVRFLGDVGYVVTFRQVDPLYTIDLSQPSAPRVLGELKIQGYSAYLHPLGNNLLLGVGQDATSQGQRLGTQVSLFDVSDPRRPTRLHQRALGAAATSEVEFDHHAFLWWPPARLAVVPLQVAGETPAAGFAGAVGLRVGRAEGIAEIGRVAHDSRPYPLPVRRSLVVGDRLYTVSDVGIAANRLDTLASLAFLPFPASAESP